MNRKTFFDSVRENRHVFGNRLNQDQVDGLSAILDRASKSRTPLPHLAYILGTVYGETGSRMQPVQENMNYSERRILEVFSPHRLKGHDPSTLAYAPQKLANVVYGGMLGNDGSNDGWTYRGHGLVQITGKLNFKKFSDRLGIDLVSRPERALSMPVALDILFIGMEEGLFTGRKLETYLPDRGRATREQFRVSRTIINGMFEASRYATYAQAFQHALEQAGYVPSSKSSIRPLDPITPAIGWWGAAFRVLREMADSVGRYWRF